MAKKVGANESLFSDLTFAGIPKEVSTSETPIEPVQKNNTVGRPKNPEPTVKKSFYLTAQIYEALLLYRDCNLDGSRDFSKIANDAFKQFFARELRVLHEVDHIQDAGKRRRLAMQMLLSEQLQD